MNQEYKMARKNNNTNNKEEAFFVRLESPRDFRVSLLECSKDTILAMKKYEVFKEIKKKKNEKTKHLDELISQIKNLFAQLSKELPQTRLRGKPVAITHEELKKKHAKKTPVMYGEVKQTSELKKLEDQLGRIQQKIDRID